MIETLDNIMYSGFVLLQAFALGTLVLITLYTIYLTILNKVQGK